MAVSATHRWHGIDQRLQLRHVVTIEAATTIPISGSVNPSSGSPSTSSLDTNTFYDHRGNVMAVYQPGGLVTKYAYDGAGRNIAVYTTDGGATKSGAGTVQSYSNAASVSNDIVINQVENQYDGDGNIIFVTNRDRFHNLGTNALGALGGPTSANSARASYVAYYYDAADRQTDQVDVGTDGGTAYTRPSSAPTGSDTVLLTHTHYNDAGLPDVVTDPRGIESETFYDMLGRTTRTVDAWDGSSDETSSTPVVGSSSNQVTDYTYDGNNDVVTQTAWDKSGTNAATFQITAYIYGVTTSGGSAIDSNDLVSKIEYPNQTTGYAGTGAANIVSFNYFATGDQSSKTDQNGTTHQYSYDPLGRLTSDYVPTFGSGVNSTINKLTYAYNDAGDDYLDTSYAGTSVENQEEKVFDGLGNVTADYQSAVGSVADSSALSEVQYVYTFANNQNRLSQMIYPDGRILDYGYDNSPLDNAISRVDYLADHNYSGEGSVGDHLVEYSYLGLNTVVQENRPGEGDMLTYVKQSGDTLAGSDGGDQYSGLDRFGRVVDQNWIDTSTGDTVERIQYGYDRDGNVLFERNLGTDGGGFSTLNTYDDLNRLASYARGTLNSGGTSITTPSSLSNSAESWSLDSQGNWANEEVDGTTTSRTTNDQNELTAVGGTSMTYDNNGNMLTDGSGHTYQYDAWNRLYKCTVSGNDEYYQYLPGSDQVLEYSFGDGPTIVMVYSQQGQVIQETDENTGAETQYVWGTTYVNDLILRDRDSDADTSTSTYGYPGSGLDERLYALRDANHDVTAITDASGTVQERFSYDPYGNVTTLNASFATASDSKNWIYLYQGGRFDSVSGVYTFGARQYSTQLGRWVQQDPAGYVDGANLYQFVDSQPIDLNDQQGSILKTKMERS